jgi:hypothetical protein
MEVITAVSTLIGAIAWPAVCLYALVYFRKPLREALELLPAKLQNVSKFSVGSLSFEIQAVLQANGDSELMNLFPRLNRPVLEKLLDLKEKNRFFGLVTTSTRREADGRLLTIRDEMELAVLREMSELGLIQFTEPIDDFLAFFRELPSYTRKEAPPRTEGWVSEAALQAEQLKRLTKMHFSLTDLGRRAYDTLFTVVIRQLTTK